MHACMYVCMYVLMPEDVSAGTAAIEIARFWHSEIYAIAAVPGSSLPIACPLTRWVHLDVSSAFVLAAVLPVRKICCLAVSVCGSVFFPSV